MKSFLTSLLLLISLTSCYTTIYTSSDIYKYDDDLTFKVNKIQEGKSISFGNSRLIAKKGSKFIFVFITMSNLSTEKKEIDLEKIYLADVDNKIKYTLRMAMKTGAINLTARENRKLKSHKSLSRKLVYLVPQEFTADNILLDNQVMHIRYLKAPHK